MLQPLKNRIIIERDPVKESTSGGLVIPEAAQDKEISGTVIAIGPDVKDIVVGNKVLFGRHDGVDIDSKYMSHKGDFILIRDEAVRAIIKNV